jgi:hypothetical protein
MGRHVPRLEFLSVLLSDDQALAPHEECYHRLLALDPNEAGELVESYLKQNSTTALYDAVLIPVITAAEMDYRRHSLDEPERDAVLQAIREFVEELENRPVMLSDAETADKQPSALDCRVLCLPARADRDELAGMMLMHLLRQQSFNAENAPARLMTGELLELVEKADAVCVSVVAPSTMVHARYLCAKLRNRFPRLKIVAGLWGAAGDIEDAVQRLRSSGADELAVSLAEAVKHLAKTTSSSEPPRSAA